MSTVIRFSGFDGYKRVWGYLNHSSRADQPPRLWVFWGDTNGVLTFHPTIDDVIFRRYRISKGKKYCHDGLKPEVVTEAFEQHLIIKKLKYGN